MSLNGRTLVAADERQAAAASGHISPHGIAGCSPDDDCDAVGASEGRDQFTAKEGAVNGQ